MATVDLRSICFSSPVAAWLPGQRHRLLRLSGSEVHSLCRLCAGSDFYRLPRCADTAFDRRRLSARLCRCALLAAWVGCGFPSYFGPDRFHDRSKLFSFWRSERWGWIWASKSIGPRCTSDLADLSTIAAPIIIQKAISHGTQVGQALFATAATAGIAGLTAGVGAATTFGAQGLGRFRRWDSLGEEPPH